MRLLHLQLRRREAEVELGVWRQWRWSSEYRKKAKCVGDVFTI